MRLKASSKEWVNQGMEEGRREGREEWRHLADSVVTVIVSKFVRLNFLLLQNQVNGVRGQSSAPWYIHGEPQTRSTNKWNHLSNTSSTNTHKYVCLMFEYC